MLNNPYVSQRFAVAVCDLITTPGSIEERVGYVMGGSLMRVRPQELPEPLQIMWSDVLEQVLVDIDSTEFPPLLKPLSTPEAIDIAKTIARINYELVSVARRARIELN